MADYIKIDIPQLVVLPHSNYHHISKRFRDVLDQTFLWSYLSQKFADYSTQHYEMNEQLRKIYLIHESTVKARSNEDMYPMDDKHYTQKFLTDQVCRSISLIVAELCYCTYFMKHIKINGQLPAKTEVNFAITFVMAHPDLKEPFQKYSALISQTEQIRNSLNVNIIRPNHDYLITEKEPVYFVTAKDGVLSMHHLNKFIATYSSFFVACIQILRDHSPEAVAIGLEKWVH